jgi:hypothetical protein
MPRAFAGVRLLACTGLVLGVLEAQLGCSANCLRNTDCDDAHVCRRNACVLPPQSVPDAGLSEIAGTSGMAGLSGSGGVAGAAGSNVLGVGGSAGASSESAGAGGSSTLPRENLDAATDADATDTAP